MKKYILFLLKKIFLEFLVVNVGFFIIVHIGYLFGFFRVVTVYQVCALVYLVLTNQILLPYLRQGFYVGSSLGWIINLPVKRKTIVWVNMAITLYYLLLGACFTFVMYEGHSFLARWTSDVQEEEGLGIYVFIDVWLKALRDDFHYGNLILLVLFFLWGLSWLGKRQVRFCKEILFKYWCKCFLGNHLARVFFVTLLVCLFFWTTMNARILSGFNVNIMLCALFLIFVHQPFAFLNDRTKSTRNILRGLVAVVVMGYVYVGCRSYYDVKDESLDLKSRVKSYFYLGYLAPKASKEMHKKLLETPGDRRGLFVRVLQYENLIDKKYLYNQLSLPCDYRAIRETIRSVGKLSYREFDVVDLIARGEEDCSSFMVDQYDQSTLDVDEAIRILRAHFEKFGTTDYDICRNFSERKFEKKEIEKLLKSDSTHSRYCGIVLARYYPGEDFGKALYSAFQKRSFYDITELYPTYVATTGKFVDYREFESLESSDWEHASIDCPSKKDFTDGYKKLDYAQKVRCPYVYRKGKVGYGCTWLDMRDYIMKPEKKREHCF